MWVSVCAILEDSICCSCVSQAAKNGLHHSGCCTTKAADRSCTPRCVTGLVMHSKRKHEVQNRRQQHGCSSQCAGTEAWGGLNVGSFLMRSKAEMEK